MKTGNKKPLRFDTQKNVRSMRLKRFAAAFSCFFVLLAGLSVLLLLSFYDFNLSAIGNPNAEETSTAEATTKLVPEVTGQSNYLLLCTADSSNAVYFASILSADMDSVSLTIHPISATQIVTAPGCTGTLEQQLDYGGEQQLVTAVENACDVEIDKYIRSTDSGFKSIISAVGGFETTIDEPIDVRTDKLTAIISAGEQTMTGDTMLKYIRVYENEPLKQAAIISDLLRQKLTPYYFENADSYYTKIINLSKSDISVLDFAQIKNGISELLNEGENLLIRLGSVK